MKLLNLLLIISLLNACSDASQNGHNKRGSRAQLVLANVVESRSVSTQKQVSGSLIAIQTVKIFNQESGQIEKLPYFPGDLVKKGDKLVFIKNDKITAFLVKSKAVRLQAEDNLKRLSRLTNKNLFSQDEISQARTALALSKAEESINQIRLNDTSIKAPFSGVISERLREPGDIVPIHTHILSLIDGTKLIIRIQVSELLLSTLILNSKVTIQIDALKKLRSVSGSISRLYPTIDPVSRKGTLEVVLDNIPPGAKPGQLCRVTIHAPAIERLLIDVAAIQYDDSGEYVFRVNKDNKLSQVRVESGLQIKNKIEVMSGLNEGDLIVTEGFSSLKSGKKVKFANNKKTSNNQRSTENSK